MFVLCFVLDFVFLGGGFFLGGVVFFYIFMSKSTVDLHDYGSYISRLQRNYVIFQNKDKFC